MDESYGSQKLSGIVPIENKQEGHVQTKYSKSLVLIHLTDLVLEVNLVRRLTQHKLSAYDFFRIAL